MKYLIVYNNPSEQDATKDSLFALEGNFRGFQHINHTGTSCHLQNLLASTEGFQYKEGMRLCQYFNNIIYGGKMDDYSIYLFF